MPGEKRYPSPESTATQPVLGELWIPQGAMWVPRSALQSLGQDHQTPEGQELCAWDGRFRERPEKASGSEKLLLLGGCVQGISKKMNSGPEAGSLLSPSRRPPCPGCEGRRFHASDSILGSAQAFPPSRQAGDTSLAVLCQGRVSPLCHRSAPRGVHAIKPWPGGCPLC